MIRKCFGARHVLSAVVVREEDSEEQMVSEAEWKAAEKVRSLLEASASVTEHQSGSVYVMISLTGRIFENSECSCRDKLQEDDYVISLIAADMIKKLEHYSGLMKTSLAKFDRIVDYLFAQTF